MRTVRGRYVDGTWTVYGPCCFSLFIRSGVLREFERACSFPANVDAGRYDDGRSRVVSDDSRPRDRLTFPTPNSEPGQFLRHGVARVCAPAHQHAPLRERLGAQGEIAAPVGVHVRRCRAHVLSPVVRLDMRSRLAPMQKVARRLKASLDSILTYLTHRTATATARPSRRPSTSTAAASM